MSKQNASPLVSGMVSKSEPRYPGTNASLGTNPNPPTSDRSCSSLKSTCAMCGVEIGTEWALSDEFWHSRYCGRCLNGPLRSDPCVCGHEFVVHWRSCMSCGCQRFELASMNPGSRVVSSASPSTGGEQ